MAERDKYAFMFRRREEIFPKWFLVTEECIQIIENHKENISRLVDRKLSLDKFSECALLYDIYSVSDLIRLYINTILDYYSNGWPILLREKKYRYIWLFFRLSVLNHKDVHKFSQKIIDDIIRCPFEIEWSIPFKDPIASDWTKKRMCEYVVSLFSSQVDNKQVEMLIPYVIDTIFLNILSFWIEKGLVNIYPYSSKIISRVKGVLDKYKNDYPYGDIASLQILGGSRYEQKESQNITQLRKFIVATNNFPELHQKLVTLFDNEVRLYNIRSFDHHVYMCKSVFESSYDIKYFQALPFINGTRMKVVKRWFKWVLE